MAHPGRGKSGWPLTLDFMWPEEAPAQRVDDVDDLPLFDWVKNPSQTMRKGGG